MPKLSKKRVIKTNSKFYENGATICSKYVKFNYMLCEIYILKGNMGQTINNLNGQLSIMILHLCFNSITL